MPRAYEPGERWSIAVHPWVREPRIQLAGIDIAEVLCGCGDEHARARLIAESPERDELLREVEVLLRFVAEENGAEDLLARIRATLARTED